LRLSDNGNGYQFALIKTSNNLRSKCVIANSKASLIKRFLCFFCAKRHGHCIIRSCLSYVILRDRFTPNLTFFYAWTAELYVHFGKTYFWSTALSGLTLGITTIWYCPQTSRQTNRRMIAKRYDTKQYCCNHSAVFAYNIPIIGMIYSIKFIKKNTNLRTRKPCIPTVTAIFA